MYINNNLNHDNEFPAILEIDSLINVRLLLYFNLTVSVYVKSRHFEHEGLNDAT